ncbi:GbsR/MarR family transcriptional regulator [Paenibacillus sp. Marseille-Q4541]|uniref:GbsR/MarR family transcriptional regulator n=1 Tax=Paenibacillus sp. Marseille-Q4541 TaxID=2831522 RepID=UPI001BA8A833|nr:GbsR/MarR family transcriptional regulator [Paenibacillus sp. Marseille-Q4541]
MSLDQLNEEQQAKIMNIRKRVIQTVGKNMELYGLTSSAGHLYGLLFFADKPMTLDEMGREMEMSKTSMSTSVRNLLDLQMVNKVWSKGSRKDQYEVEYDWHQTFTDYFTLKWRQAAESNLLSFKKAIEELNRLLSEHAEDEYLYPILSIDKQKMEEAVAYYKWLNRLIDAMESEEIFKLVPKQEDMNG